jgi:hypothetical protein
MLVILYLFSKLNSNIIQKTKVDLNRINLVSLFKDISFNLSCIKKEKFKKLSWYVILTYHE